MINIAVCDDDLEITKSINKLLMKYQDERDLDFTVDLFNDGSGLKSSILKGKKYDLIYLDIEMRQMNGIATAKYIRSIDTTVLLIYVSNYDNYLKELFEVEPFRFMSKPINDKRFYMFLDLAIDRIRSANGIYCFRFNKDILTVILRDVIYFETMKKTWMLLYEQYTDDKLSREDFLLKRRSTMKKQPDWRKG